MTTAADVLRALSLAEAAVNRTRKLRDLAPIERACERGIAGSFRAQGIETLAAFAPVAASWPDVGWAAFAAVMPDAPALAVVLGTMKRAAYRLGAEAAAADVGVTLALSERDDPNADLSVALNLRNPRAVAFFDAETARRAERINGVTAGRMRSIIRDGLATGRPYTAVAREIERTFAGYSAPAPQSYLRSRAELVAVTEMGDAYAEGTIETGRGLRAAGLAVEKAWVTVGDRRVDDAICATNERAGWIDLDDAFPSGAQRPTGHPGCRCDVHVRRKPGAKAPPKPRASVSRRASVARSIAALLARAAAAIASRRATD